MSEIPDIQEPTTKSFRWNPRKEEAALLLAIDELTDEAIIEKLDIARTSLYEWKKNEEFRSRIDVHIAEFRARVRRRGIAIIENRVSHLQRRHDLLNQIIRERGRSPEMAIVPGGTTGLIVHQVKGVGKGEDFQIIDEYVLDASLLRELREHEKQAAQELGQWTEKQDLSGTVKVAGTVEVTHKFDYDAYQSAFAEFAKGRICGDGSAVNPGNGN